MPTNFKTDQIVYYNNHNTSFPSKFQKEDGTMSIFDIDIPDQNFHKLLAGNRNVLKIFVFAIFINILCFLTELSFGIVSKSSALVSDSLHILTDAVSSCVNAFSNYKSNKKSRYDQLGALVSNTIQVTIALRILSNSIIAILEKTKELNLEEDEELKENALTIIFTSVGTLVANFIVFFLLLKFAGGHSHGGESHSHGGGHSHGSHGGGHIHESHGGGQSHENHLDEGHATHDEEVHSDSLCCNCPCRNKRRMNKKATEWSEMVHALVDASGNVLTIAVFLLIKFVPPSESFGLYHLTFLDPICSIIISILMFCSSILVLNRSLFRILKPTDLTMIMNDLNSIQPIESLSIEKTNLPSDIN